MAPGCVLLGTGGFSNSDWSFDPVGRVRPGMTAALYPAGEKANALLPHYAARFAALELNASFYAIPGEKSFASMAARAPGLGIAVKLHRVFTHDRRYGEDDVARMRLSLAPLRAAGMLGPLLAQFPFAFARTPGNRRYLAALAEAFAGERLAVEFRHDSWQLEAVAQGFRDAGLALVTPDYPPLPGLPAPELGDGPLAYLRLHGHNPGWWEAGSAAEKHDYRYTPAQMEAWAARIAALDADEVWVLFQNTTKGHALRNAAELETALERLGVTCEPPPLAVPPAEASLFGGPP